MDAAVTPMPIAFERRLVSGKGEARMGILLWWQGASGFAARIATCSDKNRCGVKRTAPAVLQGVPARCERCDP